MLGVGYERPPHEPGDDILQPSTSSPDLGPADRSAVFVPGPVHCNYQTSLECHWNWLKVRPDTFMLALYACKMTGHVRTVL